MAVIIDPDDLNQGNSTAVSDMVFGTPTGNQVTITSAGTNLPALADNEWLEIRDHSDAENNGLYRVNDASPTTGSVTVDKFTGPNPIAAASEAATVLGTTGASSAKSVMIDTAGKGLYLLEQGNLSADGVDMGAFYSFLKEEWKNDATLPPFAFPMVAIDTDAGKYEFNNGWSMEDITTESVRTKKMPRNGGWSETDTAGTLQKVYVGIITLGTFEDEANDTAEYQLGNDPTDTGASTPLEFAGPADEAVLVYDQVTPTDTGTGFATNAAGTTLTRNDAGNWITDGYVVGGQITIQGAEDAQNNGTFLLSAVAASVVTVGTAADAGTGFNFVDGGGGEDSIVRNDGGSWLDEGYFATGNITVSNATPPANNGSYTISTVTASTITVPTASLTADTGDNAATFGPLVTNAADTALYAAVDNRNSFKIKLRVRDADPNGKTYDQADLTSAGATSTGNRVLRFPLSNVTDLNISETDANIAANTPYTQILLRYFDQPFSIDVDTTTNRLFGIVCDVGTHSGVDGSFSAGGSVLTTAEGGITGANYTGGTITIYEGADEGTTFNISGTPTATTVTITGTFTALESNISFTLQRATPVVATRTEIFEKIQYLLRQDADIDSTTNTVVGATADELAAFEGADLKLGKKLPVNPNGGGSGVLIQGFDANDTNNLFFFDNSGVERQYPFVAAGTISWNINLENDTNGTYWMFFTYTERFTNTGFGLSGASGDTATLDSSVTNLTTELADGDYIRLTGFTNGDLDGLYVLTGTPAGAGPWTATVRRVDGSTLANEAAAASVSLDKNPVDSPDAIIVDNNAAADITGSTFGTGSAAFDFDYDNNVQGGRTAGTDAAVTLRAIGFSTGQWVETTGTITRATGLSFQLTSALERNYNNP